MFFIMRGHLSLKLSPFSTRWNTMRLILKHFNLFLQFLVFAFKDACVSFSGEFRKFERTEVWVGEVFFREQFFFVHLRHVYITLLNLLIQTVVPFWELISSSSGYCNTFIPTFSRPSKLCLHGHFHIIISWCKAPSVQSSILSNYRLNLNYFSWGCVRNCTVRLYWFLEDFL